MAHYTNNELVRPTSFNFANDVVDYWADKSPGPAMHWISQDHKIERKLSFKQFSQQSHRIAVLLRDKFDVQAGEKILVILPRVPEW